MVYKSVLRKSVLFWECQKYFFTFHNGFYRIFQSLCLFVYRSSLNVLSRQKTFCLVPNGQPCPLHHFKDLTFLCYFYIIFSCSTIVNPIKTFFEWTGLKYLCSPEKFSLIRKWPHSGPVTHTVSVPVPVSVTVKVYHCVNGDGPFDGEIEFRTHYLSQCKFKGLFTLYASVTITLTGGVEYWIHFKWNKHWYTYVHLKNLF